MKGDQLMEVDGEIKPTETLPYHLVDGESTNIFMLSKFNKHSVLVILVLCEI